MDDYNGESLNFNSAHRLRKAIDQLIGICAGIVADGEINDKELAFLSTWLAEHTEACREFPGNQIARRVGDIMADGVISVEERGDLLETLQQISGNRFVETGAAAPDGPAVPADPPATIEFSGRRFCFTGSFVYGARSKCAAATEARGGVCDKEVTKALDYLVIGTGASKDWKHGSYGSKIERAQKLREKGATRPVIVNEENWVSALEAAT